MLIPTVAVAVFLTIHLLAGAADPGRGWGVHFLAYHPPVHWWLFAGASVCLLLPAPRRLIIRASIASVRHLQGRSQYAAPLVLFAATSTVAVAFPSAVHLLGDGYLYLSELPGRTIRVDHSPLSFWLVRLLYEFGKSSLSAESTYRLYSYLSGLVYLLLLIPVARDIADDRVGRAVVIAFLLTAGYGQVFFGYVETYGLVYTATLLYLWVGVRVIRAKLSPLAAGLTLGAIIPLHFLLVCLVPSLLVLLFLRVGRAGARHQNVAPVHNATTRVATLVAVPAVSLIIVLSLGIDPLNYVDWFAGSHSLPLTSPLGFKAAYGLLSLGHLSDLVNQQLLTASTAAIVVAVLGMRALSADRQSLFLLAAGAVPLAATAVLNPEIGAFRDWDVLAIPSVPLTVWAAAAFTKATERCPNRTSKAVLICGAAGLHTMLWIGLNADEARAERRFTDLLEAAPLSVHARSYGWDTAGRYYRDRGETKLELEANENATAANPRNARHWFNTGLAHYQLEQFRMAIHCWERAVELEEDFLDALDYMALAHHRLGETERAEEYLRRILQLNPDPEHARRIREWLGGG